MKAIEDPEIGASTPPGLSQRSVIFLALFTAAVISFFFRWDILFYDGIYYLRSVGNPDFYTFKWKLFDRWIHVNFLWGMVQVFGGRSAFAFEAIRWIYRLLMIAGIAFWWNAFSRCWQTEGLKKWGAFFLIVSPLMIYEPGQILPEQWVFFFSGLGVSSYLRGLEKKQTLLFPLAGIFFYLGFLSRSDGLLLPSAFLLSCLIWGYRPRKEQLAASAWTLVSFAPLMAVHIFLVGVDNLSPMGKAIWNYKVASVWDNVIWSLKEYGRAAGLYLPLGLIAFKAWKNNQGVRILGTTSLLLYGLFLFWIMSGHVAYGRHTIQGALALSAFAVMGFSILMECLKEAPLNRTRLFFYIMIIPYLSFIAAGRWAVHTLTLPAFLASLSLLFFSFRLIKGDRRPWVWKGFTALSILALAALFSLAAFRQYEFLRYTIKEFFSPVFLGPIAIIAGMEILARRAAIEKGILFFCMILVAIHVGLANCATGGVEIDRAKQLLKYFQKNYPNSIVLASDDPTYYFYQFYYPEVVNSGVFLCYAGGTPEQKAYYRSEIKKQIGSEYIASLEELGKLRKDFIFYLGDPAWSWLGDEKSVRFEILPEMGEYKGFPIRRLHLENAP